VKPVNKKGRKEEFATLTRTIDLLNKIRKQAESTRRPHYLNGYGAQTLRIQRELKALLEGFSTIRWDH